MADHRYEPPIVTSGPDEEIIRLCAEFDACELAYRAIYGGESGLYDDETEAASISLWNRMGALLDRIDALRATTPEAIVARVRTLAIHSGHGDYRLDIDRKTVNGRMISAILRDTLAISGRPIPPVLRSERAGR